MTISIKPTLKAEIKYGKALKYYLISSSGLKNGSSDWLYDLPETTILVPRKKKKFRGNSECLSFFVVSQTIFKVISMVFMFYKLQHCTMREIEVYCLFWGGG